MKAKREAVAALERIAAPRKPVQNVQNLTKQDRALLSVINAALGRIKDGTLVVGDFD